MATGAPSSFSKHPAHAPLLSSTARAKLRRRQYGLAIAAVAACASLLAAVAFTLPSHPTSPRPTSVQPGDAVRWLARAGLSPSALAAAGVDGAQGNAVITSAAAYLGEHAEALDAAESRVFEARAGAEARLASLRSAEARTEELFELQSLQASLATAERAMQEALAAFRQVTLASLTPPQVATLATIRESTLFGLPMEYRVAPRAEAEQVALRDALANLRIARQRGIEADAACAATVRNARTAEVEAAAASLAQNLQPLHAAWNAALGR